MKNYGDRGGCYPSTPQAEADNSLRELNNSSYGTQPHSLIVKYSGNGAPVATERITADLKPFLGTKSACSSSSPPPLEARLLMLNGPIKKKQVRFSLDPEIVDKPVDVFIISRFFRRDDPFRGLIRGKRNSIFLSSRLL